MGYSYNYVAGGSFPPCMPKGFDEQLFGTVNIVIFALNDNNNHDMYSNGLAYRLQRDHHLGGLVYSYSSGTCGYMNCARLFRVPSCPSFVVVSYKDFQELICVDSHVSHLGNDNGNHRIHDLNYTIINGEVLCKSPNLVVDEVIRRAQLFYFDGMKKKNEKVIQFFTKKENVAQFFRKIPKRDLKDLKHNIKPQEYNVEITVLFNSPAWRHTGFESLLYLEFINYGFKTDSVMVNVLYPTYFSDEYTKKSKEYEIIRFPAVIYKNVNSENKILKIERDFFEDIPNLAEHLPFIISDIHNLIATYNTITAEDLIKEIQKTTYYRTFNIEVIENSKGILITQLRPQKNISLDGGYKELGGDIKEIKNKLNDIESSNKKILGKIDDVIVYLKPGIKEEIEISVGTEILGTGIMHKIVIPLQEISYAELKEDLERIKGKSIVKFSELPTKLAEIIKNYLKKLDYSIF